MLLNLQIPIISKLLYICLYENIWKRKSSDDDDDDDNQNDNDDDGQANQKKIYYIYTQQHILIKLTINITFQSVKVNCNLLNGLTSLNVIKVGIVASFMIR